MALKRLILLLPVLVIFITACSKQASNPVEIVAEVPRDGQSIPFTALTETPDPDAITVIVGTALPFDEETTAEASETTELEVTPTGDPFIPEGTPTEPVILASPTALPDVIMFTATPIPTQAPDDETTDFEELNGTSTPFIQATQPVITPILPMTGDSAIPSPTRQPQDQIGEPNEQPTENITGTDVEIVTTVTAPNAGTGTSTRPTLNPAQTPQPEVTATEVPEECIHTVVRGDTTFKIALANSTTVAAIQAVNPSLTNPEVISLGQRIILPNCPKADATPGPTRDGTTSTDTTGDDAGVETVHIVRSGDTLGGIARRYGVSVTAIVNRNNLTNPDRLSIGQEIIIPSN